MASPVADSYSAASGVTLYGGRTAGIAWAASLVPDQLTPLTGATTLAAWMAANMPAGSYGGNNPYGAILDAYCDPTVGSGAQIFHGGGHGDSTVNAVVKFDEATLAYSLLCLPTPPSKYPVLYGSPAAGHIRELTYPDGEVGHGGIYDANATPVQYSGGHFRSDLTLANDIPYNTTRARASSHMYAAAALRITAAKPQGVVHYFYQTYGEFDVATGTWANLGDYPNNFQVTNQLDSGGFNGRPPGQYTTLEMQQGTAAHYDSVTDRFFVTLCDGGYRSGVMVLRPKASAGDLPVTITNVIDTNETSYGFVFPATIPLPVGRNLYFFTKLASDTGTMNQGFILNMDTLAMKKFTLTGNTSGSQFASSPSQETIPAYYDGIAIRRWNYMASQRNYIYSVNTTPESGSGTIADPYVLRQTARTIAGVPADDGSGNSPFAYIYHRLSWNAAAGAMIFIPKSTGVPYALKLS